MNQLVAFGLLLSALLLLDVAVVWLNLFVLERLNRPEGKERVIEAGIEKRRRRRIALMRRTVAFAFLAGAAALEVGSNWIRGLQQTVEHVASSGAVTRVHGPLSLADIAPLLLIAGVLLLPDLDGLPTPWGVVKLRAAVEDLARVSEETKQRVEYVGGAIAPPPLGSSRIGDKADLCTDELLGNLVDDPPAPQDSALLATRTLPPGAELLTTSADALEPDGYAAYFKAMWSRLAWMLQLAENVESGGATWAADTHPGMQYLHDRAADWGGERLFRDLAVWVGSNRALRNQGWFAYNSWSERTADERRDQVQKAQYLLSRLEEILARDHAPAESQ